MANVTKAFIGDNTALIDPYVVVSFYGQVVRIQGNNYLRYVHFKEVRPKSIHISVAQTHQVLPVERI